jgi:hypothetical protein
MYLRYTKFTRIYTEQGIQRIFNLEKVTMVSRKGTRAREYTGT